MTTKSKKRQRTPWTRVGQIMTEEEVDEEVKEKQR